MLKIIFCIKLPQRLTRWLFRTYCLRRRLYFLLSLVQTLPKRAVFGSYPKEALAFHRVSVYAATPVTPAASLSKCSVPHLPSSVLVVIRLRLLQAHDLMARPVLCARPQPFDDSWSTDPLRGWAPDRSACLFCVFVKFWESLYLFICHYIIFNRSDHLLSLKRSASSMYINVSLLSSWAWVSNIFISIDLCFFFSS